MLDDVAGLAVAGVLGAAGLRRLRGRRGPDGAERTPGSMEALLEGVGRGVGTVAAFGIRTTGEVAASAARTAGRVGAATVQHGLPATTATGGWLLDGAARLVGGTGSGLLAAAGGSGARAAAGGSGVGAATGGSGVAAGPGSPGAGPLVDQPDQPAAAQPEPGVDAVDVVVVRAGGRGGRYHRAGCRVLGEDAEVVPRSSLPASVRPCGLCRP